MGRYLSKRLQLGTRAVSSARLNGKRHNSRPEIRDQSRRPGTAVPVSPLESRISPLHGQLPIDPRIMKRPLISETGRRLSVKRECVPDNLHESLHAGIRLYAGLRASESISRIRTLDSP